MRWLGSAGALVLVWAMIGGGLSAYVSWCLGFNRDRMWREVFRRAGILPLMFVGIVVSQWVINRVDTPVDRDSLLLGLIVAWVVPPATVLVKHVIAAPDAVPIPVTAPPPTDVKPISSGTAITILVVSSAVTLGAWFILLISKAPTAWVGSMGLMPMCVLVATLFLLTRQAERSGHGAQSRHLGFLWAIGIALSAIQSAAVAWAMGIVTLTLVIGVTGMLLMSGGLLAFLVYSGRSRD